MPSFLLCNFFVVAKPLPFCGILLVSISRRCVL
nr:MAG TPA: hypothetical protein [Caudoviricetes sp.]